MAAGDVLTQLAQSGATAIVAAMATDAWQRIGTGIANVLGRGVPDQVAAEAAELEASREEILGADDEHRDLVAREHLAQWRGSLRRLVATDPGAADELRDLLATLDEELPAATGETPAVVQSARADRGSTVVQAGRDVTVDRPDRQEP
jgi:hypothetical protein